MKDNEIAQEKAKYEINKNTKLVRKICHNFTGYGELCFYIYYLHLTRVLKISNDDQLVDMSSNSFDDVCKYLISCILKYGKKTPVSNDNKELVDIELTTYLTKIALHINSNYEAISFLSIFDNITLIGERNQHVRIDISENLNDQNKKNFFEYSHRSQKYIHYEKMDVKNYTEFLKIFRNKFIPYDDLCQQEFGLKVDTIVDIINRIVLKITTDLESNLLKCPTLKNGNIDVQSVATLIETINSFTIANTVLIELIGKNGIKLLEKFTFNKNDFDINQLGYHIILRQPVIKLETEFIISPQLLLDSLLVNFHYSLLESKKVKHEYKKVSADYFINEISDIGTQYGFNELNRELELYNGKKQLGDIDLILYNKINNQYILIEAKNHSLPLDVYFGDMIATARHLEYLQSKWEDKVSIRFEHLKVKHQDYKIGENFKYIIVSKYPEILSHCSDFLVLSINEFEYFMQNIHMDCNFQDIYTSLYSNENFELEQMEQFTKDFTNFSFSKE